MAARHSFLIITASWVLATLIGCELPETPSSPSVAPPAKPAERRVVTQFEGFLNPAEGTMTFRPLEVGTAHQGLSEVPVGVTGNPATGVPETVKLVTPTPPSQVGCGGANRYCGTVNMVSHFSTMTLSNAYVEIIDIQPPTARNSYNSVSSPPSGVSNTLGLWSYGTLAPGASKTAVWGFGIPDATNFKITGRVMGDLCPDGKISCGGTCVDLNTDPANCGGCGVACNSTASTNYACSAGTCSMTTCASGYGNCDGLGSNGCEVNLQDDPANCGACANPVGTCQYVCGSTPCNCVYDYACGCGGYACCGTFCSSQCCTGPAYCCLSTCPSYCSKARTCVSGVPQCL